MASGYIGGQVVLAGEGCGNVVHISPGESGHKIYRRMEWCWKNLEHIEGWKRCIARLPFKLISFPVYFADRLIVSPIISQRTGVEVLSQSRQETGSRWRWGTAKGRELRDRAEGCWLKHEAGDLQGGRWNKPNSYSRIYVAKSICRYRRS